VDVAYQYSESVHPERWRILGVKLRDFSIGHALLLERSQSPFITGERDPSIDHYALALLICSQSYENALKSLSKRSWRQKLWQWRFKVFAWFQNERVLNSEYLIREYIREAKSSQPKFWRDKGRTKQTAAPDLLLVRVCLHSRFGYTNSEIMNMPYSQANWEYYGWLEQESAVEFRDPRKEEFFSKVKEAQKKMREASNGSK
jgi:hypothetical protein